jgi:hypothetical protein
MELISLWITEYDVLPPAYVNSARMLSLPGNLYLFRFLIVVPTLKELQALLAQLYAFLSA